jgi:uncharacterized protein (TIGR02284 family)
MTTDVIALLNGLIETSTDGERSFTKAAEAAQHATVNDGLLEIAARCSYGARELQCLVSKLGGRPESGGSVAGALHRGWLEVKSVVGARSDHAILADCEKREDVAEKRFHDVLEKDLPSDVTAVVARLYHGVAKNRERVRSMRDQYAPAEVP